MRKISTEIGSASKITGEEKAVEYVAKAGFEAWDFSMFNMIGYSWSKKQAVDYGHPLGKDNYLAFARELKHIGLENGIECNQSHAPFPVFCKEIRDMLKRSIECTAEAGGKICIIHPDNYKSPEENAEMFLELLPFAKEYGVKIATENMWNWDYEKDCACDAACSNHENMLKHIEVVNSEYLVACLDIGHAEMRGLNTSAAQMIYTLKDHLQALHIHDNDKWHDSHQIPFSMNIDFNPIIKALKDIDYKGDFTLECDRYLHDASEDMVFPMLKDMAESARKFAYLFEKA